MSQPLPTPAPDARPTATAYEPPHVAVLGSLEGLTMQAPSGAGQSGSAPGQNKPPKTVG